MYESILICSISGRYCSGYLYLSVFCQIFVFITKIYKVILLMETLDLSDLRPALIETTIACLILLTMLDLYTIYVEVSFHYYLVTTVFISTEPSLGDYVNVTYFLKFTMTLNKLHSIFQFPCKTFLEISMNLLWNWNSSSSSECRINKNRSSCVS